MHNDRSTLIARAAREHFLRGTGATTPAEAVASGTRTLTEWCATLTAIYSASSLPELHGAPSAPVPRAPVKPERLDVAAQVTTEEILDLLEKNPAGLTAVQISSRLFAKHATVLNTLNELSAQGIVTLNASSRRTLKVIAQRAA